MSKATLTIEGFVAKDPELRSHEGRSVTNVSVPHTPRKRDGQGGYVDAGPTLWVQASFWEDQADVIVESVRKGTLVTITGQPELRVYQKQDGSTDAQLILKFGTLGVIPRKAQGGAYGGNATSVGDQSQGVANGAQPAAQDAWATPGTFSDQTPF